MTGQRALARHSLAVARRNLVQVKNDPGQLLAATLTPVLFTVVFLYVLGGAISGGQAGYQQYLMPGIMAQTVTVASIATGIGLNLDFGSGVMDRFRSLPIARSAVLTGRILADACRLVLGQLVVLGFALVIGFRVQTGVLPAVGAVLLMSLYGIALCWIAAYVGLRIRSMQTVQTIGFLWLTPLQFASSIFAPASTMPDWLRVFVEVNPTSLVTDTCRGLLIGGPVAGSAAGALLWIAAMIAVFAPLAVREYRRRP
ncbi:ABC transporter permease [Kutzneria viridogrisea]|uniref:Transport permease protein n=2 Tax=Kutzneria TaxID=43356 RepID=W5WCK5_9PSEU|nr:ABC transporter permease [Kutzneria albida]AHH95949.1 ABC transporter, permease component [Kutzneria albida DSM 43870]MBA8928850.1 oleandomycin transport system permease protein [Kutzneria viridogrisea]